jgi:hypothetical protein
MSNIEKGKLRPRARLAGVKRFSNRSIKAVIDYLDLKPDKDGNIPITEAMYRAARALDLAARVNDKTN